MYRGCPWSSWTIPANTVVETRVKNFTARFYTHNIRTRSYRLKRNFKCNLQKHHFVYVHEKIIKYYLNFTTCLYSPLALITWNSSRCHLMELFMSKESFKEKVDSNSNWKTARPRMILKWHLFLRLSLRFGWKMLSFCGKTSEVLPKRRLFIFCKFLTLPLLKKKEREKQKHIPTSKASFLKLLKNFR